MLTVPQIKKKFKTHKISRIQPLTTRHNQTFDIILIQQNMQNRKKKLFRESADVKQIYLNLQKKNDCKFTGQ